MTSEEAAPDRWTKATVYDDMWVDPADDPREVDEPPVGERATLLQYLDAYRQTVRMKCDGLTPEQLALRSVPPSTMSLLGLVRHLAEVERSWSRRVMLGEEAPYLFPGATSPTLTSTAQPERPRWSSTRSQPGTARSRSPTR